MLPSKPLDEPYSEQNFVSTRDPEFRDDHSFTDALLLGLAEDLGLFVPSVFPVVTNREMTQMRSMSYAALAFDLTSRLIGQQIDLHTQRSLWLDFCAHFDTPAIAPIRQLNHRQWLLELFHGPTLAFKDYALHWVGAVLNHVLAQKKKTATVLVATSGDTGGATISALRGSSNIRTFVFYPKDGPSEIQRRQMTTLGCHMTHPIAVTGNFDDCQRLVKSCFADQDFRERHRLCAVNSINFARIAAQIVYYAYASVRLGTDESPLSVVVPTGNFGNALAAYYAKKMGFPIGVIGVASNANDCLIDLINTGQTRLNPVHQTMSPSMDVQLPSNFERLLFEASGCHARSVSQLMTQYASGGVLKLPEPVHRFISSVFTGGSVSDHTTLETIKNWVATSDIWLDPHSAVGVAVAENLLRQDKLTAPVLCVATAHISKFPEVIQKLPGANPSLMPHNSRQLSSLMYMPEKLLTIAPSVTEAKARIEQLSA